MKLYIVPMAMRLLSYINSALEEKRKRLIPTGCKRGSAATVVINSLVTGFEEKDAVLRAHSVLGESHIQRNANREFATTSPPFYNEPHLSHVLHVKVAPGTTFISWSQHHFVDMSRSANTCAQSVNLIHSVL